MIAALAIPVFLTCGQPQYIEVERKGEVRQMEVKPLDPPAFGLNYIVTSGNEDIRLHSQIWIAMRHSKIKPKVKDLGCE